MTPEQIFDQVSHKSLREAALSAIRQAIVHGDLKPGQRLVESDIAEQMGISRAPVREALRQLETEGLVAGEPHRGTFVAKLSTTDLWEIYTLRATLEGMAVRLATKQISEETLTQLHQAVDGMAQAAREGDLPRLATQDMAFHETLCRSAGHTRLLNIWQSMAIQIRTFIDLASRLCLPPDEVVQLHADVIEHIQNGRTEEAAQTLTHHILKVGECIIQEQERVSAPQDTLQDTL